MSGSRSVGSSDLPRSDGWKSVGLEGDDETAGERGQTLTISKNTSGIREEKAAKHGLVCRACIRIIPGPTDS
jgi:hypothetical protein